MLKMWWDEVPNDHLCDCEECLALPALRSETLMTEREVFIPFYLDEVELGFRVSDHLNTAIGEQWLWEVFTS